MIKSNKFRTMTTILVAALFVASAFISNFNNAQMQTGANTIVFDRYDAELGVTKIFVMNADGTNVSELGNGYSPSWSANGAKIACADGECFQLRRGCVNQCYFIRHFGAGLELCFR